MRLCNKGGYCLYAVHVALGESATLATATGPERDLADLERLAREHGWVSVRSVNVVREEGEDIRYEGEWSGCWRDCTRAGALALLREKGAK